MTIFGSNVNSVTTKKKVMVHNYYLYEEKGKLSIIPWDYNLAFGGGFTADKVFEIE